MGVTVNLTDPSSGFVVIRFSFNGEPRLQEIALEGRPMRYGGRRYYFICPKLGIPCEVLPSVGGGFASRQAHRLTYRSQSADDLSRLRARADKLERQLWPSDGRSKPRGRNRARLLSAWEYADAASEELFSAIVLRRWGHLV